MLAGVPVPDEELTGVELLRLEGTDFPVEELPDVDQMRETYKAARVLSRRAIRLKDMETLDRLLGEETGLSATCCHTSILALADMRLVELGQKPFSFALMPMQKTDPASSALWRAIQRLRQIGGKEGA